MLSCTPSNLDIDDNLGESQIKLEDIRENWCSEIKSRIKNNPQAARQWRISGENSLILFI